MTRQVGIGGDAALAGAGSATAAAGMAGANRDLRVRRALHHAGVGTRSPKFAGPGFKRPLVVGLQVLEVGDGTSMWGPHGSELSYGTQLSEKGERGADQGATRTFHPSLLTRRQCVGLAWRATSANVIKTELKLSSTGIVVGAIIKIII